LIGLAHRRRIFCPSASWGGSSSSLNWLSSITRRGWLAEVQAQKSSSKMKQQEKKKASGRHWPSEGLLCHRSPTHFETSRTSVQDSNSAKSRRDLHYGEFQASDDALRKPPIRGLFGKKSSWPCQVSRHVNRSPRGLT